MASPTTAAACARAGMQGLPQATSAHHAAHPHLQAAAEQLLADVQLQHLLPRARPLPQADKQPGGSLQQHEAPVTDTG